MCLRASSSRPWPCSLQDARAYRMTIAIRSMMAAAATPGPRHRLCRLHFLHDGPQVGLALEADAGRVGQGDLAVDHGAVVGEAAERREDLRVGFIAAALQADGDVERELMAAMRHAASR